MLKLLITLPYIELTDLFSTEPSGNITDKVESN